MSANKPFSRDILKWLAVAVFIAAFCFAAYINFGIREPIEAQDKTVGLLVDYDELKRIADGSFDIDLTDMLRKSALSGATGLVVRERLLADWEIAGDILVLSGGQLRFQLELQHREFADDILPDLAIHPEKTYILTKDPLVYDQIFSLLHAKRRYPEQFELRGYMGIVTHLHSGERANLGLGFPLAQLEQAAAEGFQIIPRLRNWEPVTADNISEVIRWVSKIPNLAAFGFNDQSLPGDISNPIHLERLSEAIASLQVPLVSFEFYDQVGLSALASRLGNNLLRVHAIAENELQRYGDFQDAMDRYGLAARERNIRYIYLRFQGLIDPAAAMIPSMELIENVLEGLTEMGLNVGDPEPTPFFTIPVHVLFILGASVIAAGGWLLALCAEPFFGHRKWRIPYFILMVLALCAWAGGLMLMPVFARKLFAFAGAVFFPSLGVILVLNWVKQAKKQGDRCCASEKQGDRCCASCLLSRGKSLLKALVQLLLMSVLTVFGAIIMSALLSETAFMLKLDGFVGVKVAHIIPLGLVPFILWLREQDWFGLMSGTVKSNVKFWQLGVSLALLAGLALYILRTGNDNPEAVMDIELQARQMLGDWLGVRPRTTEFLIGHPLMLVMLYYGYRFNMFPLLMMGLMGQVSLINTYAHIHTPIVISLLRSAHGLWLGAAIGIVIIVIIELILRRLRTVNERRLETES